MKKSVLLLLIALFFLFSCKKEHTSSPKLVAKKYAIQFNVTNFSQQKGAFSIKESKLSVNDLVNPIDYLDVLYYVVYDTDSRFSISTLTQDSTQANMGTIVDSLPNGTYPVFIFAGKKGLSINNLATLVYANYGYPHNWLDTFWAGFSLTVNNGSVTRNVTLTRTVSKLEVKILDNIPANANTINMSIYPESENQFVAFGSPDGSTPTDSAFVSVTIPAGAKGYPNFTVDKLTGGTEILSVKITCKDASNHVIGTATSNNVEVDANKKTILSGKLFCDGPMTNTQTFQVKIDTAWASTTNTVHF